MFLKSRWIFQHCSGGGGRNGPLTVGSGTPPLPGPVGYREAAEGREGHHVGVGEGQVLHRGGGEF